MKNALKTFENNKGVSNYYLRAWKEKYKFTDVFFSFKIMFIFDNLSFKIYLLYFKVEGCQIILSVS